MGGSASAAAATDEFINSRFAPEDRGSSQLEALRTRYRAQRMARFIHHFTRFQVTLLQARYTDDPPPHTLPPSHPLLTFITGFLRTSLDLYLI